VGVGDVKAGGAVVEISADSSKLTKGLASAQKMLAGFGTAVKGIGQDLVGLSAVMVSPFVGGAKAAADFEQQMANVSTMVQGNDAIMAKFGTGVRQMSVEFGESTETVAGGLYQILSASVAPEDALGVLAVAMKAAKAGMTDTTTAADGITTGLNAYGLAASDAGRVSDLMFQIVARGKTTFPELAENLGKVAPVASAAGAPMEELGAMIALVTRNGIQTAPAMTGIASAINTFLKPSAEASRIAKEYGINLSAAGLKSDGLRGSMDKISKLPTDIIAKLFPQEALKVIIPAANNVKALNEDVQAMAASAGATGTAYEKMTDTVSQRFAELKAAVTDALIEIGLTSEDETTRIITGLTDAATAAKEWISENREIVILAGKMAIGIGLVGTALVAVGTGAVAASTVLGGLMKTMFAVKASFAVVAAAIGFLMSPIGIVIAGVVALGAAMWKFSPLVRDVWSKVSDVIGGAWKAVWGMLKAGWALMVAVFSGDSAKISAAWDKFTDTAGGAWKAVWNVLKTSWAGMVKLWENRGTVMGDVWDGVMKLLSRAWEAVQGTLAKGWKWLEKQWPELTYLLEGLWEAFTGTMTLAWNVAWTQLKVAWALLEPALNLIVDGLKRLWGIFVDVIWPPVKTAINLVITAVGGLLHAWGEVTRAISNLWTTFWHGLYNTAVSIWNSILGLFSSKPTMSVRVQSVGASRLGVAGMAGAGLAGQIGRLSSSSGARPSSVAFGGVVPMGAFGGGSRASTAQMETLLTRMLTRLERIDRNTEDGLGLRLT